MKYIEATDKLKKLDLYTETNASGFFNVYQAKDPLGEGYIAYVSKSEFGRVCVEVPAELLSYSQLSYLIDILSQLAMTPLVERREERLYNVQFVEGDDDSFLLRDMKDGELFISNFIYGDDYKIKFTKAEIMAINPNYMLFAVPVEEK